MSAAVCLRSGVLRRGCKTGNWQHVFWVMGWVLVGMEISPDPAQANVSVLTYHNDNARTGQNLNETILTPANVNVNSFGKLFTCAVDGYVYAQPLYVSGVAIPDQGAHNVVYVATEHDSVYAFDADNNPGNNGSPLWQRSLINAAAGETTVPISDFGLSDPPEIGVTGTPVIDPASGTLFVVGKIKSVINASTNYAERLFALDIATGAVKFGGPVDIQASVPGGGDGANSLGNVPFDPYYEFQRPGLVLANGVVYITFASQGDLGSYHGWVMGYDAHTLQPVNVFNDTPNGSEGGIWMSGAAPAVDAAGNLYCMTGNGTFDADTGGADFGDSFLKLTPSSTGLSLTDYFTPYNQAWMDSIDGDLGSGAPLLLPDSVGSLDHPHLLVGCGKQGTIYLVDRDHMGHFNPTDDSQIVQSLLAGTVQGTWSMPAYFNGWVYYFGFNDVFKAYSIANASMSTSPVSRSAVSFGYPGATPSISANGTNNAVAWVIEAGAFSDGGPAVLHAYNARNLAQELYNSSQAGTRDQPGLAQKFSVPTVANGKVYVGTGFELAVFGNFTAPVIAQLSPDETVAAGANVTLAVAAVGTPPLTYQWQFNGADLVDATNATLALTNLEAGGAGNYTVTVSNPFASATSDPAVLTVVPASTPPVLSINGPGLLTVEGVVGQTYAIEYVMDFGLGNYWLALANLTLTNPIQTWADPDAASQSRRFYRAVAQPF